MIFGVPKLWGYGIAVVAALLFVGGVYLKGRSDGKAVVQAVLNEQRATWQQQFDRQTAETARIQDAWDDIIGERDELQKRLADAASYGESLGNRLRDYKRAGVCSLSDAARAAAGTEREAQVASLIERIRQLDERIAEVNGRIIAATAKESAQLNEVLDRYEAARNAGSGGLQ